MTFADALNIKAENVERPVVHPKGTYLLQVSKPALFGDIKSKDGGEWDTVTFPCKALEPKDDVDPSDLAKAGGIKGFGGRVQFMFNKGSSDEDKAAFQKTLYQMTRFLTEHLGIPQGTVREMIDKANGMRFLGTVDHRADKEDKEIVYAEIKRTAPEHPNK